MKKLRRTIAAFLSCALLAGALAACAGNSSSSSASSPAPSPGSSSGPAESGDGKLTVALSADAISLSPYVVNDVQSSNIQAQIYDTLIKVDDEGNITPDLAESYEQPDNVTYTFSLKKGVKFHNGEELKASDVVFSLKQAAASENISHIFGSIDADSFQTPDDYTVTFKIKTPNPGFLLGLSHTGGSIVSEKAFQEAGEGFGQNPVGTGPFKFVSWSKNNQIVLERNDDYFGEKAKVKDLTFRVITEATNRAIELESGGVDLAYGISSTDISRIEENQDLQLFRKIDNSTVYIGLNTEKKPFTDVRVRQAISYAIDTKSVVETAYRGVGKPAVGPIAPNVKYSDPDLKLHEYNVDKAKQLLKEAGYPDGFTTTVLLNNNQTRVDMLTIVQSQLKEVGITLEIKVLEWGAYIQALANNEHEIMVLGWTCQTPDPDMAIYAPFSSKTIQGGGGNYARYTTPELDALIEKGRELPDSDERRDVYYQIQKLIVEGAPWIFLNNGEQVVGASKKVQDFDISVFGYQSLAGVSVSN